MIIEGKGGVDGWLLKGRGGVNGWLLKGRGGGWVVIEGKGGWMGGY